LKVLLSMIGTPNSSALRVLEAAGESPTIRAAVLDETEPVALSPRLLDGGLGFLSGEPLDGA
jgi:hypothetical protein